MTILALVALLGIQAGAATADTSTCPCSLFASTDAPTVVDADDSNAVEIGVQFTVDIAAPITGVRFYKAAANTGEHVGSLWSSTGTLLAQASFSAESASGWQSVTFATPVQATPGTLYVASYHTNVGHYSVTPGFFNSTGVDNGILHAPGGNSGVPNGVFAYSPVPTFPANTYNGNNYYVDVTVGNPAPALTAVTVAPGSLSLAPGASSQLSATGSYSDGSTANLTGQATWTSSNPAVATVSATGSVTATGTGSAIITAASGGQSGSSSVTVAKVVRSLAVAGASGTLAKGLTRQLTATATFTDSSTSNVTGQASWTSSRPAVATVNATGLVTATGVGTAVITASYGGVSASTTINAGAAVVTGLVVSPGTATINLLSSVNLTAIETFSDGSTIDVTNRALWTTSNLFVANVSSYIFGGRVGSFIFAGKAVITAYYGGLSDMTAITVR